MIKVAIVDSVNNSYVGNTELEKNILGEDFSVDLIKLDPEEPLPENIGQYEAIISWHLIPLPKEEIHKLTHCRVIVRAAVGFDNIDVDATREKGIVLANVPDYGTEEVADHTIALLLAGIRNLVPSHRHVLDGGWQWNVIGSPQRLSESELVIVGFGRIGKAVAMRAKSFGIKVSFYDPYVPSGEEKSFGVKRYEVLEDALSNADIVSIHTPLNSETKHLIDERKFDIMKDGVVIINCARGGIISTDALVNSIKNKKVGFAALDVVEEEPNIPQELIESECTLFTPHSAFYSDKAIIDIREKSAGTIKRHFNGQLLRDQVN